MAASSGLFGQGMKGVLFGRRTIEGLIVLPLQFNQSTALGLPFA
jgi:hypothetical protein